jgi:hypothetical protein
MAPTQRVERIEEYTDTGFDHVELNQVNFDADAFFELVGSELVPAVS